MTQKDIELLEKSERKQKIYYGEGSLRSMIMSCLIYGNSKKYFFDRYAKPYINQLGKKRVIDIWKDQESYFKNHCKILENVFVDDEGVSYNSVVEY